MRVWERGAGETRACGTGASAAAVAAMRCGLAARKVRMNLPGGPLDIEWRADNHIFMTGEAVTVFEATGRIKKLCSMSHRVTTGGGQSVSASFTATFVAVRQPLFQSGKRRP